MNRRSSSSSTTLDVMQRVEDLATLSARLQAPFAVPARVLDEAGLTSDAVERARERWSASILADHALAERFQRAYTKERDRLAGDCASAMAGPHPAATPAAPSASLAIGSPANAPAPAPETAALSRVIPGAALPFQPGTFDSCQPAALVGAPSSDLPGLRPASWTASTRFVPEPSAGEAQQEGQAFDADATLPVSGLPSPSKEPALPFAKLPSQILLPSRKDDPSGSKKRRR
jgi:hypothetical protein